MRATLYSTQTLELYRRAEEREKEIRAFCERMMRALMINANYVQSESCLKISVKILTLQLAETKMTESVCAEVIAPVTCVSSSLPTYLVSIVKRKLVWDAL